MALRKVPGSLALGLLASLGAHAALYGGEHAIGGAYHALLVQIALAATVGFVAFAGAFAWIQSGNSTEGQHTCRRPSRANPGVRQPRCCRGHMVRRRRGGRAASCRFTRDRAARRAGRGVVCRIAPGLCDNEHFRMRRHRDCPHVLFIAHARVAPAPARPPDRTPLIPGTPQVRATSSDRVCSTARIIARKALFSPIRRPPCFASSRRPSPYTLSYL